MSDLRNIYEHPFQPDNHLYLLMFRLRREEEGRIPHRKYGELSNDQEPSKVMIIVRAVVNEAEGVIERSVSAAELEPGP